MTVIYLALSLPKGSCSLPGDAVGRRSLTNQRHPSIWPCSRRGFPASRFAPEPGALLPHRFTLACVLIESRPSAVWSLWHFPSPHAAWVLPSTLPEGVRTFLSDPKPERPSSALDKLSISRLGHPLDQPHISMTILDCHFTNDGLNKFPSLLVSKSIPFVHESMHISIEQRPCRLIVGGLTDAFI